MMKINDKVMISAEKRWKKVKKSKTMKNCEKKTVENGENLWKTMKNNEKWWKTMKNGEKRWKKVKKGEKQ